MIGCSGALLRELSRPRRNGLHLIASEAKQSNPAVTVYCFVAALLAMTTYDLTQSHYLLAAAGAGQRLLRDQFGDLPVIAPVTQCETFNDTFSVFRRPVLAHLPLAFETRDGKAEADN